MKSVFELLVLMPLELVKVLIVWSLSFVDLPCGRFCKVNVEANSKRYNHEFATTLPHAWLTKSCHTSDDN